MANPTSNFNWQMPTSSDLVTDLPADFEVFGQAVDTSLADLKGGTTNQVLAKNSDTDMDFKWVADAAGMTNPMTTTGDTIYSSSGSTPARLGIGSTGQVLTVAAGVPSWAAPAAGGMTQISSTTLAGASTTVSSIPSGYNALIVEVVNFDPATNDRKLNMRFNADSGSARHKYVPLSTAPTGEPYDDTVVQIQRAVNSTTVANHVWLTIPGYARTDIRHHGFGFATGVNADNAANISTDHYHVFYNQTGAITSLEFLPNSGNFAGGTVILWGVK